MQTIDLSLAMKATEGDLELLQVVIEAFLEEYPALLAELEPAIRAGDNAVVQRASHTIKGTLRLFGNVPSRELAERLEEMGCTKSLGNAESLGKAAETYDALKLSLASLRRQLSDAMKNLR